MASSPPSYPWKPIPGSSHDLIERNLRALPPGLSLLDLGAASGELGSTVRDHFARIIGVEKHSGFPPRPEYDVWIKADLETLGAPPEEVDVIVAADVLEHLGEPHETLRRLVGFLRPGGRILVSVPNVANFSVRAALLAGRFPYAERGILDRSHLRFFTRASARELLTSSGWKVVSLSATAVPVELALPALGRGPWRRPVRAAALLAANVWPTLFGYQFVLEAIPA